MLPEGERDRAVPVRALREQAVLRQVAPARRLRRRRLGAARVSLARRAQREPLARLQLDASSALMRDRRRDELDVVERRRARASPSSGTPAAVKRWSTGSEEVRERPVRIQSDGERPCRRVAGLVVPDRTRSRRRTRAAASRPATTTSQRDALGDRSEELCGHGDEARRRARARRCQPERQRVVSAAVEARSPRSRTMRRARRTAPTTRPPPSRGLRLPRSTSGEPGHEGRRLRGEQRERVRRMRPSVSEKSPRSTATRCDERGERRGSPPRRSRRSALSRTPVTPSRPPSASSPRS